MWLIGKNSQVIQIDGKIKFCLAFAYQNTFHESTTSSETNLITGKSGFIIIISSWNVKENSLIFTKITASFQFLQITSFVDISGT